MPGEGRFETTEQLCQTLTSIMFTSTVGHAAVNVSQYDEYAFLPNYPAILKGQPPRDKVDMSKSKALFLYKFCAITTGISI